MARRRLKARHVLAVRATCFDPAVVGPDPEPVLLARLPAVPFNDSAWLIRYISFYTYEGLTGGVLVFGGNPSLTRASSRISDGSVFLVAGGWNLGLGSAGIVDWFPSHDFILHEEVWQNGLGDPSGFLALPDVDVVFDLESVVVTADERNQLKQKGFLIQPRSQRSSLR